MTVRTIIPNSCIIDPKNSRRLIVEAKPLRSRDGTSVKLCCLVKLKDLNEFSRNKSDHEKIMEMIRNDVNRRGTVETPRWKNLIPRDVFKSLYSRTQKPTPLF